MGLVMKRAILSVSLGLILSGCFTSMDKQLTQANQKSTTPIINTLRKYEYFNVYLRRQPLFYNDYSELMIPDVNPKCVIESYKENKDTLSDECILYNREHPLKESTADYFNYNKYLPSEYNVKNRSEFDKLYKKFLDAREPMWNIINYRICKRYNITGAVIECDSDGTCKTQEEFSDCAEELCRRYRESGHYIQACHDLNIMSCRSLTKAECKEAKQKLNADIVTNIEKELQYYIKYGMREEIEEKEAIKNQYAKANEKHEAKIREYKECINKANLCMTKIEDGIYDYKIGCREALGSAVASITPKGVLLESKKFVYTNKKYTSGSDIDSDKYYEYVGTYDYTSVIGTHERVRAFKETNIPVCRQDF